MSDDRIKKAGATAKALFGKRLDTGVDTSDGVLTDAFAHVYGEVWSRPGLDLKTRSLITVAALVALNKPDEMRIHLQGALNVGWTRGQLREAFLQLGYYAGFPAALDAMRLLDETTGETKGA
ncbi:MAG TPA: carboxymuconolactone decarboxylase family protein [Parvularculaceae bacterium]|nr:carboxymuconolactone decarboxylase family protein [Parvularculaceae bacterium]